MNINSRGEVTLLFPNRFDQNNHIRAGKTYTIPDRDYGFSLKVQPPRGKDRVFALAGGSPLNIFDTDFSGQSFLSLERGASESSRVRGIGVQLKETDLQSADQCTVRVR